jgi:hypothetical protein
MFQNHAASICEDIEGNFITEDEAHYICAILNTPIVEKYVEQSSDSRSYKIRPPVKIPKFNGDNKNHKKLVKLSREAHAEPANSNQLRKKMERIYLKMIK